MDRTDLQHDAFTLNGVYLEDVISGYMTYLADGRESLDKKIETYTNGTDGETLKRTSFPLRKIKISYVVQGTSLADLREKMHTLQDKLNVNNAVIVFNDDPDCYYIATPVMDNSIKDAKNAAMGTFDLVCHDPFKYSKTLTQVDTTTHTDTVVDEDGNTSTVTSQVLTTNNTGGYKTYPKFEVQFATDEEDSELGTNADCGYVLFAKGGTDYSVQIGDDQEKDIVTYDWLNHAFAQGKKGGFVDTNSIPVARSNFAYNGSSKATDKGLMLNSSANVSKKYHGPLAVFTCPTGYQALGDFTLTWKQVLACAKDTATAKKQTGAFMVMLLDNQNNVLFSYGFVKSGTTHTKCTELIIDYVNGEWKGRTDFNVAYTGKLGYKSKTDTVGRKTTCSIKRHLEYDDDNNLTDCRTIITTVTGKEYTIVEETPAPVYKLAFFFGKWNTNAAFHSNRVTAVHFTNGGVDEVNTFGSGDLVEVDCSKAEIVMNDKLTDSLGDVGNNWEDMYLDVGTNTMYVQYSDWVVSGYEPTIKMFYRKRWL